jgi:signal transduction histidine kinase
VTRRPLADRWRTFAVWGVLAAVVAAGVVWRARDVRTGTIEEVERNYAVTTRALLVTVTAWTEARGAHAEAMAALLADDPAFAAGAAAPNGRLEARFARTMDALARHETFVGGWVLDRTGRVLARAGTSLAPADAAMPAAIAVPGRPRTVASAADRRDAHAPDTDARAATVPCGRRHCAAFRAPVRRGAGSAVGTVVLLAMIDDSTFRPFNPMRAHIRTGRTSLLAPVDGADSLVAIASVGAPGSPTPALRRRTRDAPPHVQRALDGTSGVIVVGRGPGLHGRPTIFGVGRIPEVDWVVVREVDRAEVEGFVRRVLLVEVPILGTLLVSLVALGRNRIRARRVRRDEELTRLRADFVASTSHELRTPLAQIRMFAELLQRGALRSPDESARALRIIEKEASRLTILVDNLLNYTRLRRRAEHAADLAAIEPTHVADEVTHVIDAFAPLAAERGARVVSAVPVGLHARVDSLALRQVLTNYLENAVKYGPPGQTVTVGASADTRCVRLWVDDEGDGVPRAERDGIWDAFRRGGRAEASVQGGSGIGLAVVRELTLQYGGGVGVGDAPRGGARFHVEFPRAGAPAPTGVMHGPGPRDAYISATDR